MVFPTSSSATTGLEKVKVRLERRSTSPAGRVSTRRILSPPKTNPLLRRKTTARKNRTTKGKSNHKIFLCFFPTITAAMACTSSMDKGPEHRASRARSIYRDRIIDNILFHCYFLSPPDRYFLLSKGGRARCFTRFI